MIFNTTYSVSSGPTYPLGDPIKYPVQDIPTGQLKLYTEQYISDIGRALQIVTATEDTYTTQEMSDAVLNCIPKSNMKYIEFDLTFSTYSVI